jgi:hypothetical protein
MVRSLHHQTIKIKPEYLMANRAMGIGILIWL